MVKIVSRNPVNMATTAEANFCAHCEGNLFAFTKEERRHFESGITRVAIVASVIFIIELILLG